MDEISISQMVGDFCTLNQLRYFISLGAKGIFTCMCSNAHDNT